MSAPAFEGMYSQLLEDELRRGPDVGHGAQPVHLVRLIPGLSGPGGPYRLATICLAVLCGILLVTIIVIAAQHKRPPGGGGGGASEIQIHIQNVNVSNLTDTINRLLQEKEQLLARLASKAPVVVGPTEAAPAPIVCPLDWQLFNNSCYFISRVSRDWPESQSYCQSKGAHLAIIHTAEEQTFLWELLPRGHWNAYWFGITDKHTEDQWTWVDGTPLVGGFWEVGEPNNHIDEDCGYIVKTRVMERVAVRSWYDAPCTMNWPYICEKEMGAGGSTGVPH